MQDLLQIIDNEPRVSHKIVAQNIDIELISIKKMIDKNISHFTEFGLVSFKMTTVKNSAGAVNETKTYYLNEPQATFLMTLLRNKPIVVEFKKKLVKAFYAMKEESNKTDSYIGTDHITLISEMVVNFMSNIQTQNIEMQKQQNKILDAVVANSNAIVELASAINENARYTRMAAFETAMNVYSIDQTLNLKNIDDTLSKSMMDDLKKLITSVSKTLCMKHDISLADMQRLVYGKLNTKFGVSTYYKIEYLDFQKAMYFVHNMKLSGKTVESTFEPIINLD